MNAILCRALSLLFAATVCTPLLAGIGDIDPAFGDGGMLNAGLIAVLPDGKILMTTADGYARKMPDGKPDLGFGINGLQAWPSGFAPDSWLYWSEKRSATTADGSTLVGGHTIDVGSNRYKGALARLQPGGGIDTTFGEQGIVRLPIPGAPSTNDSVHMPQAVIIQPDGRILVLSLDYTEYWSEEGTVYLQRFESDGRRDPAFGIGGELKPSISMSEVMGTSERMQYLRDGRIKLGPATYLDALGQPQAAPTASAIPDTANPGWFTVGRMPGGDSIVAHLGNDSAFSSALRIARVDSAGRLVASFGQEGTGMSAIEEKPGGWIFSSSVSPDGRFAYLASLFEPPQGQPYSVIERIELEGPGSGRLDPSFGKSGQVPMNPEVTGLNVFRIIGQADGSVIVGGYLRTLRLLGSPGTAPGVIGPKSSGWAANAGASRIELVFSRFGGTDGTVGLHYETYSAPSDRPEVLAAVAGTDYTARSGTVEWTNGDSSDKSVFIELPPGVRSSLARVFHVRIDQPSGGALLSAGDSTATLLTAPAVAPIASSTPTQAVPGNPSPSAQGGGGALDLLMLSFWLSLLGACRNRLGKIQGQRISSQ